MCSGTFGVKPVVGDARSLEHITRHDKRNTSRYNTSSISMIWIHMCCKARYNVRERNALKNVYRSPLIQ